MIHEKLTSVCMSTAGFTGGRQVLNMCGNTAIPQRRSGPLDLYAYRPPGAYLSMPEQ